LTSTDSVPLGRDLVAPLDLVLVVEQQNAVGRGLARGAELRELVALGLHSPVALYECAFGTVGELTPEAAVARRRHIQRPAQPGQKPLPAAAIHQRRDCGADDGPEQRKRQRQVQRRPGQPAKARAQKRPEHLAEQAGEQALHAQPSPTAVKRLTG